MARRPEMGKYLLWQFFSRSSFVGKYLPDTKRYSAATLKRLLNRYRAVYVKPVAGSQGKGILKVWKQDGKFLVQKTTLQAKSFVSLDDAMTYLDAQRQGKAYIVQQGLRLARVNGRPFDIRVMMQRTKPGGAWLYSGMLAKVAGRGSVVTNVAISKGAVMQVESALRRSLGWNDVRIESCITELKHLCFAASNHFDTYQNYRELGFDVAVDQSGRIWMIEQNTGPSHPLFAKLTSNPAMYRTIQFRWGQFQKARTLKSRKSVS